MIRIPGRALRIAAATATVAAAALLSVPAAQATHAFTVTRNDDPVPGTCGVGDCSLREAVIAANAAAGEDTIELPPGTYNLTIPDSTEAPTATDATQGDLDVTGPLNVHPAGDGSGAVTVDAGARFTVSAGAITVSQPGTTARVFHLAGTNVSTVNVTVTGGSANQGAGIHVEGGSLHMNGGGVSGNVANGTCCGGGISAVTSSVTLLGAPVSNNAVAQCCGGGLYNESSAVLVSTGAISDNDAFGCCGAGIHNWSDPDANRIASLWLSGVHVTGNDVRDCCGGGLYNELGGPIDVGISHGSMFTNNTASDDCCGGALYSKPGAIVDATRTSFSGNTTAACCGGAIYNEGRFLLDRGSITHNSTTNCCGGGLSAIGASSVTKLANVTVSSNTAGAEPGLPALPSAGGLYLDSGQMTLAQVTVANNSGSNGASGIANGDVDATSRGTVTLARSIVADSTGAPQCLGPMTSQGYNIASDSSCTLTQTTDRPATNPQLAPLSSGFHGLNSGSPAIDAIPTNVCPSPGFDQVGTPRPQDRSDAPGTGCDIGAIEMLGNVSPTPTPTPEPIDPRCGDPGVICGTDGSETITGTGDGELIICGDGDDVVRARGGDDTIECGNEGDTGDKEIYAGKGDDEATCEGAGDDDVAAGGGNDRVFCGAGNDRISGGAGNDRLGSTTGNDVFTGGRGHDRITAGPGSDSLTGGRGNDKLRGGRGRDEVWGDGGDDVVGGGRGRDTCNDGRGDDFITGCERFRRPN